VSTSIILFFAGKNIVSIFAPAGRIGAPSSLTIFQSNKGGTHQATNSRPSPHLTSGGVVPNLRNFRKPRTARNSQTSFNEHKLVAGQSPSRMLSALNCLWIVRAGRPSLLGRSKCPSNYHRSALTLNYCGHSSLTAPHRRNAQSVSRNQPRCNFLRLPPFEAFRKPKAILATCRNQHLTTSVRIAIPVPKHNVENPHTVENVSERTVSSFNNPPVGRHPKLTVRRSIVLMGQRN
jgi:hypothetical protein